MFWFLFDKYILFLHLDPIILDPTQVLQLTLLSVTKVLHLKVRSLTMYKVVLHSFITKLLMILRLSFLVRQVSPLLLLKIYQFMERSLVLLMVKIQMETQSVTSVVKSVLSSHSERKMLLNQ